MISIMRDTLKAANNTKPTNDEPSCLLSLITLTIPVWTFITFYLLLLLIHYLRHIQFINLYDRCTPSTAHFRYDFHLVFGKYTANYNRHESHIILDLLDNQLISTMTIQVPGSTIFNDSQVYMYEHVRKNLRSIKFSIYRRHPIKDVRCIRVAHSCNNLDSRLFIYGVNLYDSHGENKFFPITSVVKYRGTQWALNTTFEPKQDIDFTKLGCDIYDPFSISSQPTYMEFLVVIFFVWCSVFALSHVLRSTSVTLHALILSSVVGIVVAAIVFVYMRFIKTHTVDLHYETTCWKWIRSCSLVSLVLLSFGFWATSLRWLDDCETSSWMWPVSCVSAAIVLSLILLLVFYILRRRRKSTDTALLNESDSNLMKTNSKANIEFIREDAGSLFSSNPPAQNNTPLATVAQKKVNSKSKKTTGSQGSVATKASTSTGKKTTSKKKPLNNNEETLENAFANSEGGTYMKTKNRNSISQYV